MGLKTGDDYLRSMKSLDLRAHVLGETPRTWTNAPDDALTRGFF
jgi:hypothetical protein